jgi:hypothetical protein
METLTIGEVARRAGVGVGTICTERVAKFERSMCCSEGASP